MNFKANPYLHLNVLPLDGQNYEQYCGKKKCCKKFKEGKRCKKCPGRKKLS